MLELLLCSMLTVLPDYLFRRYVQGKRLGREIKLFSVWFELRWGITFCLVLTIALITMIFYFHPSTKAVTAVFRTVTILPETSGRVAEVYVDINERVAAGQPLFRLDDSEQRAAVETARRRIAEVEAEMVVAQGAARRGRGPDRAGARRAGAGAGGVRRPRRAPCGATPTPSPSARSSGCRCVVDDRSRARSTRRSPARRRSRPSIDSSAAGAEGQRRGRAARRRRSSSTRRWSSPASTASSSSSRCGPATSSTR